jgi:uncharacterized lipoprotein YddW (UPF0748 family)
MSLLMVIAAATSAVMDASGQSHIPFAPIVPRFEKQSPLPSVPGVMIDSFTTGNGLAEETARGKNLQARILWIDATANIDKYNTEDKIIALVKQIHDVGFNTIVFDVKPISGQVVYPSKLAPKLLAWRGQVLPEEFDPVAIMVRECKKNHLELFASLNAFSEGHRLFNVGPGYQKEALQTVLYEPKYVVRNTAGQTFPVSGAIGKLDPAAITVFASFTPPAAPNPTDVAVALDAIGNVAQIYDKIEAATTVTVPKGGIVLYGTGPAADYLKAIGAPGQHVAFDTEPNYVPMGQSTVPQIPLMMNPNEPDEQKYVLDIVHELLDKYDLDGIIYDDRFRYAGLNADFSVTSRNLFEQAVNKKLNWPDDVFKYTVNQNLVRGLQPGPYYDAWMAWRAMRLKEFIQTVRHEARMVRPTTQVGLYVGSWYGEYPALGDNYAADDVDAGFWFLTPAYQHTGLASSVDFLVAGCYYPTATIYEALGKNVGIGSTVEASATLVNRMARDQTWTYAGLSLMDFAGNPEGLQNALQAACASTQGVMVFDLSHNIEPMWPVFARAFQQPRTPPHARPEALADLRRRRAALDRLPTKTPPVVIVAGSSGTGQN